VDHDSTNNHYGTTEILQFTVTARVPFSVLTLPENLVKSTVQLCQQMNGFTDIKQSTTTTTVLKVICNGFSQN